MLRTIYPYVGIIQIRFWVQTIQPVLSLLTASSPFVRHYSAVGRKMQSETKIRYLMLHDTLDIRHL